MISKILLTVGIVVLVIGWGGMGKVYSWGSIRLKDGLGNGTMTQEDFESLSRELGFSVSSFPLAPAEPLEVKGLDMGLSLVFVDIHDEKDYWQEAIDDGNPIPVLALFQFGVRKGILESVDLGISYVPRVYGYDFSILGGEVKWSFIPGSMLTPTLALRLDYHRLFGSRDFVMQAFGSDVSISRGFGSLTPYTGIGVALVFSSPDAPEVGSVKDLTGVRHYEIKGFAGVRITLGIIQLVPEIDLARNLIGYCAKFGIIL